MAIHRDAARQDAAVIRFCSASLKRQTAKTAELDATRLHRTAALRFDA